MRELSGVSFIRALSLSWWASASWPNCLPNVPPPNSITFRVRISDKNFGRTTWTELQPTALTIALFGSVDTFYPKYYLKSELESVSPSVLSDSLWSHGLQTARLLCPWNSPGKNTEVGSHALLHGIFLIQESNLGFLYCSRFFTIWATREAQYITYSIRIRLKESYF